MPTTAAISTGVGALGSLGAAGIGAFASQNASSQQVAAQMAVLAQQKALFQQGLGVQSGYVGQATNALNPFVTAGQSVLPILQGLLTPGSNQNALLAQTPGFNFASQYGTMAATNALAARGGASGGGNLASAISSYNNGLAQNTWQTTINALQNYAGMGANAAGTLGSVYGSAGNAALGQSGVQGGLQGQTIGNIGNAQAAGTLGTANALAGGLTGATGGAANALLFSQLFGNGGGLYSGLKSGNAFNNPNSNSSYYGPLN